MWLCKAVKNLVNLNVSLDDVRNDGCKNSSSVRLSEGDNNSNNNNNRVGGATSQSHVASKQASIITLWNPTCGGLDRANKGIELTASYLKYLLLIFWSLQSFDRVKLRVKPIKHVLQEQGRRDGLVTPRTLANRLLENRFSLNIWYPALAVPTFFLSFFPSLWSL